MTKLLAVAAIVAASGCVTRPAPAPDPASQGSATINAALALATFDTAWSTINRTYYDSTFRGIDWAGVRAELRPAA